MRLTKSLPPQEYLLEIFSYNKETGVLTWNVRPKKHFKTVNANRTWNTRFAYKEAGCIKPTAWGLIRSVRVDYQEYLVSRIIWKMVTGEDPPDQIDHENRNALSNEFLNLRAATPTENSTNTRAKSNSKTGLKGVSPKKGKFVAQIRINGEKVFLGYFGTAQEAHEVYCSAAKEAHGKFACN